MPRTNLCNRLVFTSTPRATPFPGFRLSPSARRDPPRASVWVGAQPSARGQPRRRWMAIAGVSSPGSAEQLVLRGQLLPNHHPRRDPRCPALWPLPALSAQLEPDDPTRRRPVSLPAVCARHPEPICESQSPLPRTLPKGCGSTSSRRLPPTSPTVVDQARARPATAWAATGALALPPRAQLPTCVHAPTRGALDPSAYRLFAGAPRPHAACQLLQRSVPRAHQRAVRSLTCAVASHAAPDDVTPFGASPAGLSQARGRLAFRPRRPPPRRPLAAVDLPQPDRPEHLLSRVRVDPRLE
jgi:hypothetical protein